MTENLIFKILALILIYFTIVINMVISEIKNKNTNDLKPNSVPLLVIAVINSFLFWVGCYILLGYMIWKG